MKLIDDVSADDLARAIADYDSEYPQNDYRNWLENGTYKFAIFKDGKPYPHVELWRRMTGHRCHGGPDTPAAERLKQIGFPVQKKPHADS
jgi:hypothetical protein